MSQIKPIDSNGNLKSSLATYLMISMTKRCNMRCPGCYYLQQDEDFFSRQDITLDKAREVVRYYRSAGIRQAIPNSEGEVLLHPDYSAFVRFINQQGFKYKPWLTTNAIRLPKHAEFVARNISEILISIDGSTHEKYAASRGGNKALFNKVMAGLNAMVNAKRLTTSGPTIIINCVVTADRCDDIPDMIRLAEDSGADVIKFTNFHAIDESEPMRPVTAGEPETDSILQEVVNRNDYNVSIFLPSRYEDTAPPYDCRMLNSIMIGSNGDFAPCCRMVPEKKWGNFFTSIDKHNNEKLREFRLSVLNAAHREDLPGICQRCAHLSPKRLVFVAGEKKWYLTNKS